MRTARARRWAQSRDLWSCKSSWSRRDQGARTPTFECLYMDECMMIVVWWNAAGGRTMQFVCEVIWNKKPMISITASSKKLLFFVSIICARELSHLALQSFIGRSRISDPSYPLLLACFPYIVVRPAHKEGHLQLEVHQFARAIDAPVRGIVGISLKLTARPTCGRAVVCQGKMGPVGFKGDVVP